LGSNSEVDQLRARLEKVIHDIEVYAAIKCPVCGGEMFREGSGLGNSGRIYHCVNASREWETQKSKYGRSEQALMNMNVDYPNHWKHLEDSDITIKNEDTRDDIIMIVSWLRHALK
jgi:hypothetical protein